MEGEFPLEPPFHGRMLKKIARAFREEDRSDIADTIGWLLEHNSSAAISESLRSAWSASSLPLREWADQIDHAEAWVLNDDLKVAVHLVGSKSPVVWQAAPIEHQRLQAIAGGFPQAVPEVMEQLALAAPGLSLNRIGALGEPRYFTNRLGYVTRWLRKRDRESVIRRGYDYPDPERHLMEVVANGIGDCYVLGVDDVIHFFDHEADGMVPCTVNLEELIEKYFDSPEDIIDPFGREWAEHPPEPQKSGPSSYPPTVTLHLRSAELPHLAAIALCVRGCERALPGHYLKAIPPDYREHNRLLHSIIERCREVVLTGKPCDSKWAKHAARRARRAGSEWNDLAETLESDYLATVLTFYALPALAVACSESSNAAAIREALAWCSDIMTKRGDDPKAASRTAIWDMDYLLSLNLGAPGTSGRTVPAEFFDRPQWPEHAFA